MFARMVFVELYTYAEEGIDAIRTATPYPVWRSQLMQVVRPAAGLHRHSLVGLIAASFFCESNFVLVFKFLAFLVRYIFFSSICLAVLFGNVCWNCHYGGSYARGRPRSAGRGRGSSGCCPGRSTGCFFHPDTFIWANLRGAGLPYSSLFWADRRGTGLSDSPTRGRGLRCC